MGKAITADILGVEVLKISHEGQLLDPDAQISSGDKLLLYVHDEKTLRILSRIITQE